MSLSKMDDTLLHQMETTFDHVADSDPRWYERYWFNVHDLARRFAICHGLGVYPNANLMDGFSSVVHQGLQRNVRCSKSLNHERMDTFIGPLSVKVVKGLKEVRIALAENDQEVAYDLTFRPVAPPLERVPMEFIRVNGRVHQNAATFIQCGRVSGWVRISGETFQADPDTCWATKSNSWGTRSHVGGPEVDPNAARQPDGRGIWQPSAPFVLAQFNDRYLCLLDETGEIIYLYADRRSNIKIVAVDHRVEYGSGNAGLKAAHSTFTDEHGRRFTISALPWSTVYLRGAFGGYKDYFDGLYRGEQCYGAEGHVETDRFELSESVATAIAGRDDHVCEFRHGDEIGYGVFEIGVRGEEPYAPPGSTGAA